MPSQEQEGSETITDLQTHTIVYSGDRLEDALALLDGDFIFLGSHWVKDDKLLEHYLALATPAR